MTTPGAVRRQRLDPERRRDLLIDATVAILATSGYEAASVNAVARQAGVSKGLMWRYFTDREDLMAQTAQRTLVVVRDAVAAAIDLSAPAPVVIRAAIRRAVELLATHGAELKALREIVANLRGPDGGPRFDPRDNEETYQGQERIFRRGQQEGTLDPNVDPRLLAVTYQGAVDGMLTYLEVHPEVDRDAYAIGVAELLLNGFARKSAAG
jgi:AcrR family transcriptional regulator